MRQVHAAFSRQQEFAADRRHGVIHLDLHAAGSQHFSRHQACGAATDDRYGSLLRFRMIQRCHLLVDADPTVWFRGAITEGIAGTVMQFAGKSITFAITLSLGKSAAGNGSQLYHIEADNMAPGKRCRAS
ncbi:hypothetical protein [Collimonas arenae]|uniref:hypothetical protein n=1 Tax=Collimonas arenae TaxID=279058 RepID=UPI001F35C637|nr:hypothetical protein [Collimonas arenae]